MFLGVGIIIAHGLKLLKNGYSLISWFHVLICGTIGHTHHCSWRSCNRGPHIFVGAWCLFLSQHKYLNIVNQNNEKIFFIVLGLLWLLGLLLRLRLVVEVLCIFIYLPEMHLLGSGSFF